MATSSIKIDKWFKEGFEEILCSPGADEVCKREAVRIQAAANARNRFGGEGYEIHGEIASVFGSNRVEWWVKATDFNARKAEAEDKALTGAI